MGSFVEVCRRGGLKVKSGKSKEMVLGGEEGLECKVCINSIRLKHISEFKYLEYVLDLSGTDDAECCRKVESGRKVAGGTKRFLVNVRSL